MAARHDRRCRARRGRAALRPVGARWWAVWPVLSIFGATYTRSYDQLLLLPPLIISTAIVAERSRRKAVAYAAVWGMVFLPGSLLLQGLAAYRDRENFTKALTVVVFIILTLVHFQSGRSTLASR